MPPRIRTQSDGRPAAKPLGGGTGVRVGKGGRGRRPREGNDERVDDLMVKEMTKEYELIEQLQNLLPAMLAQFGNQGNVGNQNGYVVNQNVQENIRNVIVNVNQKMEYVQDINGCSVDQKVKYTAGSFVGKALTWVGHAAYTDRFYELARMVAATKLKTMQKVVQISGALTDEAVRNGSINERDEKEK
ncbi:hypothetical protein Tco_0912194 [Tanacetum coccineum]